MEPHGLGAGIDRGGVSQLLVRPNLRFQTATDSSIFSVRQELG